MPVQLTSGNVGQSGMSLKVREKVWSGDGLGTAMGLDEITYDGSVDRQEN